MPPQVAALRKPAPTNTKEGIYTWDEVKTHNSADDCWIVVEGKVYDVTSWVPRHPGGQLVVSGGGRDSTAFMHSYHPRYVMSMLTQYCIGSVDKYDSYYKWDSKFYSTLKARVEQHMKDNSLTRDSYIMYAKTVTIGLLWTFLYYFGLIKGYYLSTLLLAVVHSQIGINIMHDGNHGAYSSSPLLCQLAAYGMDFMGSSSTVWIHQHNVGHHPNSNNGDSTKESNKLDPHAYDPDANGGFPFVRLSPAQPVRWYMRYQHIYIWFLIAFMNFKWFINDFRSMKNARYTFIDFWHTTQWDLYKLYLTKGFFFLYALAVPVYNLGWGTALTHFFTMFVVTGYCFVLMFAVNHLTEDSSFPDSSTPAESRDWAVLQVMTSSNFANGSTFWTMVSGGLNFQIEHHLFPGVNHTHLPGIAPIVKQTCKEFGIPYTAFPTFSGAVQSYYMHVKNMGREPMKKKE